MVRPLPGRAQALAQFHVAERARVAHEFSQLGGIQVVQLPPGANIRQMIARYERAGLVEFAEPDYRLYPATVTPDDPRFLDGSAWHLHNTGQNGGLNDADIDAPEAWETLHSASNIVVAIVDTAIRPAHEDLAAHMWVNPGDIPGNGIDDDGNGIVDDVHGFNAANNSGNPIDLNGHGTQVAGAAGAVGNNGVGTSGTGWRMKLMACRFFDDAGSGFISDAVKCIDYSRTNGAQVINVSFVTTNYSTTLYNAINACRSAGIIVAAAAGNDARNTDVTPYYPASFNLDNIVAVASTTRTDALSGFSNFGASSVDLGAPGEALFLTYHTGDTAYLVNSGTSFASPVVAGAFALMKARYPTESYSQLISRVFAAADPLPSLSGKCATGGRLNLSNALGPSVAADFAVNKTVGELPLTVYFTNTSFGVITNYHWDFGDGTQSSLVNPVHTFASEGHFNVTLTVTGASGAISAKTRQITTVANYQISAGVYNWIDPTGMTAFSLANDGVTAAQTLPFSFRFYDQNYSQLHIGANGLIGFENQGLNVAANVDMPNAAVPNSLICPFWDDLNPAAAGTIYFGVAGTAPNRKAVISWVNVRHASNPPASYTFQTVLEEGSHRILFQYQNIQPGSNNPGAAGKSATIGVEHSTGLVAAKYSFNGGILLSNNQAVLFTPGSSGGMSVTPSTGLASSGAVGGPFLPTNQMYTIQNTGDALLNWMVMKSQNWVSLSATNGSLGVGASTNISVTINSNASALPVGTYLDNVEFRNLVNGVGNTTREASLVVNGATGVLSVTPLENYTASGLVGGPFSPQSKIYTLQNSGDALLTWSASASDAWISFSATNGSLGPGANTTVTVILNSETTTRSIGEHAATVYFINGSTGQGNTNRLVTLTVNPVPPPSLTILQTAHAEMAVELFGEPGRSYVFEQTFGLVNWTSFSTNTTGTNGRVLIVEPASGAGRFIRAINGN